ncbi:hypothetical protein [Streptomyces resistomycificus]|uniref:Uncharacterized protein n=1 Tax=Streptomyces resistomycificus TaxID=67356 RepID=A0A0L8LG82_9ACTN|nr:hypothetical protein [Streptomyces resistomycificus]KOG37086.1 hypothetical protein ADK37_11705 [Streptomyces resistomycificus]KUN95033.1 hypothetical protein AQJ84_23425 [Streptomyces resistomycificus]
MARCTRTVPRAVGPRPVAALLSLLAVLVALLSPPVLGSSHPHAPSGAVSAAEITSAPCKPFVKHADPVVCTAAVLIQRDVTGERHVPPVPAPDEPSRTAVGLLQSARTPLSAVRPPRSRQPAACHGVRAPPSLSGTHISSLLS